MKTLSIRQPWAWLILRPDLTTPATRDIARRVHAVKPVENRTWETMYRGPLLIHAGQQCTRDDYEACQPPLEALQRGGIVGRVSLVACTRAHESPYFCGPFGWVLQDPTPLPFTPAKGRLGLYSTLGVWA